ncbi:NAD(P)-dependent dehydrogenase, short-chain alcohol dehydrogenase family [Mucilaginibacter mallensis]|uniref:NAD(P)-dependent dehydrogenase, short-chain alcohol dehydrogenase family n=1 Tax=Mucilaginibacter mallensis TaxID=652787 RepID=A0A1H2CBZ4_MUCMA|nr:SDR family oxidoreductase [Mucilaginibacter mallensis]SDT67626.1 NAD(P)-dependent dehydrogenase, short-chain alcohol dehydrogenase family [Mucilaginibacter mallensis]
MENKNKIALVTGGSRGLGKDMALRLAEKGLDIILTYNSNEEAAQNVAAQIEKQGQKAAILHLNTGDLKSFASFAARLKDVLTNTFNTGHIDYLINNAGIGGYSPIAEVTEEFFDGLMNIHFKGVYFLTQKLLPLINDGGGIVNISSGLTRVTVPGSSVYASLKTAVETFTKYLAKELGERKIRANVVAPGAVMTDFGNAHLRSDEQLQKMVSSVTALGRPGVAEDIGGVVAFLCTEDARWVNGQRIEVAGGMQL